MSRAQQAYSKAFSLYHALAGASRGQGLPSTSGSLAAYATAVPSMRATGNVPPGHLNSDLSPTACHIGLGRRRDLTLRQDLCLWKGEKKLSLAELFHGKKIILVGFPGGPVCTEQHIPGYVQMADTLAKKGVDKVVCITQDDPVLLEKLVQEKPQLRHPMVELLADRNGGFIRLMGLELGDAAASGPKCQRFAGIVEGGILLKVKVEQQPADLKQTDVKSMVALWDDVYGHLQQK
mmetsp:Transcript_28814/g.73481  ORF Transcript_28814/g.73481 Transcript_28814/m.73481 type:complete len:235 (-) Transcript_28814:447-1151(-)